MDTPGVCGISVSVSLGTLPYIVYSPSQLRQQGANVLADKLTESLRQSGDLDLASPNIAMIP